MNEKIIEQPEGEMHEQKKWKKENRNKTDFFKKNVYFFTPDRNDA